jgi:hypothetical protein
MKTLFSRSATLDLAIPLAMVAIGLVAQPARAAGDATPSEHGQSYGISWNDDGFHFSWGGYRWGGGSKEVEGSDHPINDTRPAEGVQTLLLQGPIDVVLKQGPANRVTVHTDDNIAPLVETTVEKGELRIRPRPGTAAHSRHPVVATVEIPSLSALHIEGSGDVRCGGWTGDLLEISLLGSGDARFDGITVSTLAVLIRGSGDVSLAGKAARQGFDIEGSGDVHAHDLVGESVGVKIAGSGDADVWATHDIDIEINGSGDVHYRGPAKAHQRVLGSGDITHD